MRLTGVLGCLVPVLQCAGCASVTQGTTHPVRIKTIGLAGIEVHARSAGNAGGGYYQVDEVAELVGMAP